MAIYAAFNDAVAFHEFGKDEGVWGLMMVTSNTGERVGWGELANPNARPPQILRVFRSGVIALYFAMGSALGFLRHPNLRSLDDRRIRINDQWRVCFLFDNGNAWDVEIVDYH